MAHLIDKDALVAMIKRKIELNTKWKDGCETLAFLAANEAIEEDKQILSIINSLKVIEPYEHLIQYPSREDGIKAHAEDYSWNIESELFQQLTPEQQKLWRKEIEQAVISGGYCGLNLAKDRRYDTLEVKEVDLNKEIGEYMSTYWSNEKELYPFLGYTAKYFFELGMQVSNKAQKGE